MKFICDRTRLNDVLQMIAGVVDAKHPKELLRNVKVEVRDSTVVFSGTDLDIGMHASIPGVEVEEPGQIILPISYLSNIVRESKDERFLVRTEESSCFIDGQDSHYRVLGLQSDEFPEIPAFPEGEGMEIEGAIIREMIHKTSFAAAPEKMRYALNGVFFVAKENTNKIEMVATDGRRLSWIQRKANKKSPFTAEAIIPTKGAQQMERMVRDTEVMRIVVQERHIFAKTAESEIVAQLVDGKFPNYRDVVPKDNDKKIEIDAAVLAGGIRRASLLAETDEDSRAVALNVENKKMVLTSHGARAGDAKVELDVEYEGEAIHIDLNPDYMMDGLKSLTGPVRLELRDAGTPCLIRQGTDYLYLTMPLT